MTQTIDPIPFDDTNVALCCYVNSSSKIQVVRITNIPNWYFERVVFPGQRLMFETNIQGQLEIHSGSMASSILEDKIPCTRLRVDQVETSLNGIAMGSGLKMAGGSASDLGARHPIAG